MNKFTVVLVAPHDILQQTNLDRSNMSNYQIVLMSLSSL